MKLMRVALRSVTDGLHHHRQLNQHVIARTFLTNIDLGPATNGNGNANSSESGDDFQRRIFGGLPDDSSNTFFRKFDRIEKARYGPGMGSGMDSSGLYDGDNSFSSSNDGVEGKLKKAASYFEVNPQEFMAEDYSFRPDVNFRGGTTYTPEDLDLNKPGVWKPGKRAEFEVTTKEVLRNADFRNVRFLANFLTEAGIIIKRSKTGISANAQRKVAREIKKARAFGLLPFTTMGTKAFVFGKTMEDLDQDFELEPYDGRADADDPVDPVAE